MSFPTQTPITKQGNTFVGSVNEKGQGLTLHVSGDFNGATITAGYEDENSNVLPYNDVEAVLTSAGEMRVGAGQAMKIFLIVTDATPTDVICRVARW